MTTYLPSWRGWLAVIIAVAGGFVLPTLTPARSGHTGRLVGSVPVEAWAIAAAFVCACIALIILAWRRAQRSDRIAAVIALALTVWLIIGFVHAAAAS